MIHAPLATMLPANRETDGFALRLAPLDVYGGRAIIVLHFDDAGFELPRECRANCLIECWRSLLTPQYTVVCLLMKAVYFVSLSTVALRRQSQLHDDKSHRVYMLRPPTKFSRQRLCLSILLPSFVITSREYITP